MGVPERKILVKLKLMPGAEGPSKVLWWLGLWLGMTLGFFPTLFIPQAALLFLLLLAFRIPWLITILSLGVSYCLSALFLDQLFHLLGTQILSMDSVKPLWTALFNIPLIPFTRFNNTVMMGAMVVSLILFPLLVLPQLRKKPVKGLEA